MNEMKCPHCGTAFAIDEAQYASIVQQVRNAEFESELHARLAAAEQAKRAEIELAEAKVAQSFQAAANEKDAQIQRLVAEASAAETVKNLAVAEAVAAAGKDLSEVKAALALQQAEQKVTETALRESHAKELALKDEIIARATDYKAKMSVKLLGESLEQHCEIEFNRNRSLAFPNATFGKDNDASGGTKGDYILRDRSDDGVEYISIMFEMKNESDLSTTKKKNADFFAKLDKDRNDKGCEYAVLVSMLEEDSDLYTGITDVSHEYPKMFVVRPQFFLAIIGLLRNAAQATIQVKAELEQTRQQEVDVASFEAALESFQTGFDASVKHHKVKHGEAIDEIDKAIARLEKVKEALRVSGTHLDRAAGKAEGLSIRKLLRGNATMRAKFAALVQDDAA